MGAVHEIEDGTLTSKVPTPTIFVKAIGSFMLMPMTEWCPCLKRFGEIYFRKAFKLTTKENNQGEMIFARAEVGKSTSNAV